MSTRVPTCTSAGGVRRVPRVSAPAEKKTDMVAIYDDTHMAVSVDADTCAASSVEITRHFQYVLIPCLVVFLQALWKGHVELLDGLVSGPKVCGGDIGLVECAALCGACSSNCSNRLPLWHV